MTFVKGQVTNPAGAKPGNQNAKGGKANLKHGYYSLVKIIRNRRGALDRRRSLGKWFWKPLGSWKPILAAIFQ